MKKTTNTIEFDEDKEYESYLKSVETVKDCLHFNDISNETSSMIFTQLLIESVTNGRNQTTDDIKNIVYGLVSLFLDKTDLYLSIQNQKRER